MTVRKVYSETFDLVHRREASRPNAIWQADHAQLNILILRDNGSELSPGLRLSSTTTVVRLQATHCENVDVQEETATAALTLRPSEPKLSECGAC